MSYNYQTFKDNNKKKNKVTSELIQSLNSDDVGFKDGIKTLQIDTNILSNNNFNK